MERQRINMIVFLFFVIIAETVLSGDDDRNGEIVSYARVKHRGNLKTTGWGMLTVWECPDSRCDNNCEIIDQQHTHFGHCKSISNCPGKSQIYHCSAWAASVVMSAFNNPYCMRPAYTQVKEDGCYSQDFIESGPNNANGQCEYNGHRDESVKYYKYNCWLEERNSLQMTENVEEEAGDVHMNIGIAISVLLSVSTVGVIAGYLIHRKRKQSAQEKLLGDANDADQFSA